MSARTWGFIPWPMISWPLDDDGLNDRLQPQVHSTSSTLLHSFTTPSTVVALGIDAERFDTKNCGARIRRWARRIRRLATLSEKPIANVNTSGQNSTRWPKRHLIDGLHLWFQCGRGKSTRDLTKLSGSLINQAISSRIAGHFQTHEPLNGSTFVAVHSLRGPKP